MDTLSYGFKRPDSGDKGATLFTALEDDITQLNDHTHNGTNSSRIAVSAMPVSTQSISSGSWAAVSGQTGHYSQTVTLSGGLLYNEVVITFRHPSTGDQIFATVTKASSTSYVVYTSDNTIGLTAVYV